MSKSKPLRDFANDHSRNEYQNRHEDERGYTDYSEALPSYTGEYNAARDEYGDSGYHSAYLDARDAGYSGEVSAQFPAQDDALGLGGLNGVSGGALVPLTGVSLPTPIAKDAPGRSHRRVHAARRDSADGPAHRDAAGQRR